jgi:hypothetical protein
MTNAFDISRCGLPAIEAMDGGLISDGSIPVSPEPILQPPEVELVAPVPPSFAYLDNIDVFVWCGHRWYPIRMTKYWYPPVNGRYDGEVAMVSGCCTSSDWFTPPSAGWAGIGWSLTGSDTGTHVLAVATDETLILSTSSATMHGHIISDGGSAITGCSFTWGTNPDGSGATVLVGATETDFSYTLVGLTPGTTYYCQTHIVNATGHTADGGVVSFSVVDVPRSPVVVTNAATSVAHYAAVLNGDWTSAGNPITILEVGFDWGPTTSMENTIGASISGTTFSNTLGGLSSGYNYYFRAKVRNAHGWGYGSMRSFTTPTW